MALGKLAWLEALLLCAPLMIARAEEPLVPEGEGIDLLDGAQWAVFTGPRALASSLDGKVFATASDDGVVRLWDASTARETRRFPRGGAVSALALSSDGKFLATGGRDGSVQLWETATGKSLAQRPGDGGPIASLSVSPDGKAILFAGLRGSPSYWRHEEVAAPVRWSDIPDTRAIAWSPDGRFAAIGHGEHLIVLVDAPIHKIIRSMNTSEGAVTSLTVSPDGKKLAAGTDTGLLYVWDLGSGQMRSIEAHARPVNAVLFAGSILLTAATDGTVRLWNEATLQIIRKLKTEESCCTGVSLSGQTALTLTNRGIARWDIASGQQLTPIRGQSNSVVALAVAGPAAHTLALAAGDGTIRIADGATGKVLGQVGTAADNVVALTADEKRFAYSDADHAIHIVNVDKWKDALQLPPLEAAPSAMAFAPDGRTLVAAVGTFGLRGWDVESGKKVFEMPVRGSVNGLVFTADGASLVTGEGLSLAIRNGLTGAETKRFSVSAGIASVSVSSDGKKVAAGLADGSVVLGDAAGTAMNGRLSPNMTGSAFVALTHDGKSAVTAGNDGAVHFWTLAGNHELGKADSHAGAATGIAVSADDGIAMISTAEGAVTTWDVKAHTLLGVLRYGPAGWASVIGSKILRSDHGGFVLKANDKGELVPAPPRSSVIAPDLVAEPTMTPVGQGPATGSITLKVSNAPKTGRAYWVTVEPSGLPQGMAFLDHPVIQRLEPGTSASITIPISYVSPGPPSPINTKLELRIMHSGGRGPVIQVPVKIRAAHIDARLISMEGARETPVLRLELTNSGDEGTGPLTVTPEFVDDKQVVGRAPIIEVPNLTAGARMILAVAGPPDIVRPGVALRLTSAGPLWPTYAWTDPVPLHRSYAILPILAIIISVLAAGAILFVVFVIRNPIVVQLAKDPSQLRQYELSALPKVERDLRRAMRLKAALASSKLPENRWNRAVKAGSSPEGAAAAFADVLGAKRSEQPLSGLDAWAAELPAFDLRFPRRTAIVVVTGAELEVGAAAALATALHAEGEGPTVAIALDLTGEQNARPILQSAPHMSFVVVTAAEFRDLIYADDPKELFQRTIVTQRPLSELSPYQSAGGVEDESLFFGREKELRTIADRTLHNFIVVAPRQMGKSSLLKAVQRRLSSRAEVEVHLIEMSDDDVSQRIARALNRPRADTPDAFIELAAGTRRKPRVWLIDECDRFIVRDARYGYPLSQAMRTLSEEGRAFFILSGFWHLYAAVALNANNPLRNFGEMLRLEPLDRNAARDLATKPMEAMGISYADPSLVEVILDETGCRAHLITVVCRALVASLGSELPVIDAEAVNAALVQNPALWDEFKYWRREPLGRALVRLTLLEGPGTRAELRERLKEHGLEVTNEMYHATVDRLDLGYVLVPNAESRLECPVPVLRRFVELEDDLESGLKSDIEEILGQQLPPPEPPPEEPPPTEEEPPTDEQAPAPDGEAA